MYDSSSAVPFVAGNLIWSSILRTSVMLSSRVTATPEFYQNTVYGLFFLLYWALTTHIYVLQTNLIGPRQTPKQHLPPPPPLHPRSRVHRHDRIHKPTVPLHVKFPHRRSSLWLVFRVLCRVYICAYSSPTSYTFTLGLPRSSRYLCNAASFIWCVAEREGKEGRDGTGSCCGWRTGIDGCAAR